MDLLAQMFAFGMAFQKLSGLNSKAGSHRRKFGSRMYITCKYFGITTTSRLPVQAILQPPQLWDNSINF